MKSMTLNTPNTREITHNVEQNFQELDLKGAYIITPFFATDTRGCLIKDYNINSFKQAGINHELKETFYTVNKRGVIRAIHFQLEKPQPKLMRCITGRVYYVIVDLRKNSETFGQWRHCILSGDEPLCVLVPAGFGQGYLVLEELTIMSYKASEVFYEPGDNGIKYDDPDIGIDWPFEKIGGKENLIISDKDKKLMSFEEYEETEGVYINRINLSGAKPKVAFLYFCYVLHIIVAIVRTQMIAQLLHKNGGNIA